MLWISNQDLEFPALYYNRTPFPPFHFSSIYLLLPLLNKLKVWDTQSIFISLTPIFCIYSTFPFHPPPYSVLLPFLPQIWILFFVTYLTIFQRQQWNIYQMLYSVIICRSIIIFRILCLLADRIFLLLITVSWHCSIKEQSISLLAATFSHELTLNYFFPLEQAWTCPWQDTILGLPLPGRFSKAFSEGYYIPSFEILTIETASKRHIVP